MDGSHRNCCKQKRVSVSVGETDGCVVCVSESVHTARNGGHTLSYSTLHLGTGGEGLKIVSLTKTTKTGPKTRTNLRSSC